MEARADDQTARDSRLLHALCCDVGFSQEAWARRLCQSDVVDTCIACSGVCNLGAKWKALGCGSQSEGIGMDFLGSDKDLMIVLEGTRVVEQSPACPHDTAHTFQLIPTGHPAYVRLQFMSAAKHRGHQNIETPRYCEEDEDGRFVLNGNGLKGLVESVGNARIQGPAVKDQIHSTYELDNVIGLRCKSWPSSSAEWRHRPRPYNWPSPDTINEICNHGCELVSIGNPVSVSGHLEWRLSSSLAEKTLIRSFNIYQIQCYFLLKMVLAFLIKPQVPHTLSSYHMKTVMLHVVETTDPAEWTETNLTRCFIKCLEKLHSFILEGNCPQYFIPGHNLFEHRVQGESRARVLRVVEELLSQGWKCVLQCEPFNNTNLCCGHSHPRCPCYIRHWQKQRTNQDIARRWMCVKTLYKASAMSMNSLSFQTELGSMTTLLSVQRELEEQGAIYCPNRQAAVKMQLFIKGVIGYRLLSATTAKHANNPALLNPILEVAKGYLEDSCDVDMASGRLKLATFLYQTGQTGIKYVARTKSLVTRFDRMFKNVVFVDPLVYALYLLVVCYKDLGRLGKSRRCLELMSRIIRSPHLGCVFYPDVDILLLEYCVHYVIGE